MRSDLRLLTSEYQLIFPGRIQRVYAMGGKARREGCGGEKSYGDENAEENTLSVIEASATP